MTTSSPARLYVSSPCRRCGGTLQRQREDGLWLCSCYFQPSLDMTTLALKQVSWFAISIQQPFAWLVSHQTWYPHGKDIENRDTNFVGKYRGRVLIHAGKSLDAACFDGEELHSPAIYRMGGHWSIRDVLPHTKSGYPTGAFVGSAYITDVVTQSASPWFRGRYGIVLEQALPFKMPIPFKGQLGLFRVNWPD